jgi:hypothetical protein
VVKQWVAAILSPLHWVIMRFPKRRFTLPLEVQTEVRRLFDEDYYLSRYPDAGASGRRALEHFLACRNGEGRNPNSWFDTKWYLGKYREARQTQLTAFEHFLWRGRFAGYRANGGEQSEEYLGGGAFFLLLVGACGSWLEARSRPSISRAADRHGGGIRRLASFQARRRPGLGRVFVRARFGFPAVPDPIRGVPL